MGPDSADDRCAAYLGGGSSCSPARAPGGCCGAETVAPAGCGIDGYWCPPGHVFTSGECGACVTSDAPCERASDCALDLATCCSCDAPTLADVVAVRDPAAHRASVCEGVPACDPCVAPANPYLVPICDAGHCAVLDVASQFARCTNDSDCRVRYATCCGCSGTDEQRIASAELRGWSYFGGTLDAYLCDGASCTSCAPDAFGGWDARCFDGVCRAIATP